MKRAMATCSCAMLLLAVAACAPAGGTDSTGDGPETGRAPDMPFSGTLVLLDGDTVATVDGQSGERADVFEVEGELGWSGLAFVTADGTVVYESLADNMVSLRSRGLAEDEDHVIADGVSAIHGFDGIHLLFSDASDTRVWYADSSEAHALDIGKAFDALISRNGVEVGYAAPANGDADESSAEEHTFAGEPEQTIAVRGIAGPGDGAGLVRGWHAFDMHLLDDALLLYTALEFGGSERGDLILFDRHSSVTTTIAPEVRVLDTDADKRLAAADAAVQDPSDGLSTQLLICDLSEPETPTVTPVGEPVSGYPTQVRLLDGGQGLLAALRHEGGGSALVFFDLAEGSQKTLFDTADEAITQLVLHPSARLAFFALQSGGTPASPGTRTLWVCDIATSECAPVLEASSNGLLQILGIVPLSSSPP